MENAIKVEAESLSKLVDEVLAFSGTDEEAQVLHDQLKKVNSRIKRLFSEVPFPEESNRPGLFNE